MNYQKGSWLALVLFSGGIACKLEDVNSDAIRTQGLYAEMLAIAPGKGQTVVRVNLAVGGGGGTKVQLVGDDVLLAEDGGEPVPLAVRGHGSYEVSLEGEALREITVTLARGAQDDEVQASALLPEPFFMQLEPASRGGVNRSTPAIVTWDSADDGSSLEWSVEGECIWPSSGITPDDGVMTVLTENVRVRPTRVGEECEARLTLDRVNESEVDPLFVPGSSFRAMQRRAVTFVSTPAIGEKNGPGAATSTGTATP